jgi:hypothetical protein
MANYLEAPSVGCAALFPPPAFSFINLPLMYRSLTRHAVAPGTLCGLQTIFTASPGLIDALLQPTLRFFIINGVGPNSLP